MSVTDEEAIQALIKHYEEVIPIVNAKIAEYEAMSSLSLIEKTKLKRAKESKIKYSLILEGLYSDPESQREAINRRKAVLEAERAAPPPYPNFTFGNTNGYERLSTIKDTLSKYQGNIKLNDRAGLVFKLLAQFGIPKKDIHMKFLENESPTSATYHHLEEDLLNYLYIKETFESALTKLKSEFLSDYSLTVNVGSGGLINQILPRDESYKTQVLERYPKHLILSFDKEGGEWQKDYKELFTTEPDLGNESNPHTSRMKPIQEYLGVEGVYTKLSDTCFQYTYLPIFKGVPTEVRFVFFNSLLYQFAFYAFEPLIQNASLRIAICTVAPPSCVKNMHPYILNHFDYYITNYYSKNPEFTKLLNSQRGLRLLNLNSFRSKAIGLPNIIDKVYFNNAKLEEKGVVYKKKGNATFWNIIKGGNQTKRKYSKKRKTRRSKQ
jgi:hypothetical protein